MRDIVHQNLKIILLSLDGLEFRRADGRWVGCHGHFGKDRVTALSPLALFVQARGQNNRGTRWFDRGVIFMINILSFVSSPVFLVIAGWRDDFHNRRQ